MGEFWILRQRLHFLELREWLRNTASTPFCKKRDDREKIIELKKVNKHYGGVHALKDVDFSLNQGEIHCLIGQNGCGKSTMIKVISGVIGVDPGSEVILDGKKSTGGLARQAMAAGVRVIYQDLSIFPNLTVAENIAAAVQAFKEWQGAKMGRDVNPSYLTSLLMQAGAKRVKVRSPVDTIVLENAVALIEETAVVYGGTESE